MRRVDKVIEIICIVGENVVWQANLVKIIPVTVNAYKILGAIIVQADAKIFTLNASVGTPSFIRADAEIMAKSVVKQN